MEVPEGELFLYANIQTQGVAISLSGSLNPVVGDPDLPLRNYATINNYVREIPYQNYQTFNLTFDSAGNLYASYPSQHQVACFSPQGSFLFQIGTSGSNQGQLSSPQCVTYHRRNDHLLVANNSNGRIEVFKTNGAFVCNFGYNLVGNPIGIAVDLKGTIFVSNTSHQVHVFTEQYAFVRTMNNLNVSTPYGLGVLSTGHLVIASYGGNYLSLCSQEGQFLGYLANGQLSNPYYLTVDPQDNILVACYSNNMVKVVSPSGQVIHQIGSNIIQQPIGIALSPNNQVFVSGRSYNSGNYTILAF